MITNRSRNKDGKIHFVWNIGERLGTKNGYNGYARADFIKAMFPDVMKDIEQ
jgi:hypothetical protein